MKILFITPYVPSLIRVRSYNFIKALHARGHEIHLAGLVQDKQDLDAVGDIGRYCRKVHTVYLHRYRSFLNCLIYLPTKVALQSAYCFSGKMKRQISSILEKESFDVIHLEHIRAAGLLPPSKVPAVFDAVDCISFLYRQFAENKRQNMVKRIIAGIEAWKLKRYEPLQAARFDRVCITSEKDRQELLNLNGALKVEVVVNGVDLKYFRSSENGIKEIKNERYPAESRSLPQDCYAGQELIQKEEKRVVFTGKMSYFANEDAVRWFVKEVWPIIKHSPVASHQLAVKLYIAGSEPGRKIRRLVREDVVVTGFVPDLKKYIAAADVIIAPVTVGAGVQNKVLEAMAMSKAVVATSMAVQALQVSSMKKLDTVNEENICVADSPLEFAVMLAGLLRNEQLVEKIGCNARRYVETNHNWGEKAAQLEEIYFSAIKEKNR